jgi:hypothetical protein
LSYLKKYHKMLREAIARLTQQSFLAELTSAVEGES